MNSVRIDKWFSLFANGAVLIGIVFLAMEIQQSNRIATAGTELGIRNQFIELNKIVLENPEIAALLVKAVDADAEFLDVELEQAYAYLYAFLNAWASIEHAYTRGLVTESTMNIALADVQALSIDYPGFRPLIKDMLETIPHTPGEARTLEAMQKAVADL